MSISQEFELRQKTCWEFKWKIQQAMQSSKRYLIGGTVHVDEFFIGGEEAGKPGRSKGDKKLEFDSKAEDMESYSIYNLGAYTIETISDSHKKLTYLFTEELYQKSVDM